MRIKTFCLFLATLSLNFAALDAQDFVPDQRPRRGDGDGGGYGRRPGGGFNFNGGGIGGQRGMRGGRGMRRNAPVERASTASLELHGMVGRGRDALVSITNIETGESQWVRLRDERAKWYVESINPKARSAIVQLDGMTLKLDMITSTGEPMSIRPQATPLSSDGGSGGEFNAQAVASRMLAFRNGNQVPAPEQQQALWRQIQTMTPEQRSEVFQQLRQMGGDVRTISPSNTAAQGGSPSSQQPAQDLTRVQFGSTVIIDKASP